MFVASLAPPPAAAPRGIGLRQFLPEPLQLRRVGLLMKGLALRRIASGEIFTHVSEELFQMFRDIWGYRLMMMMFVLPYDVWWFMLIYDMWDFVQEYTRF